MLPERGGMSGLVLDDPMDMTDSLPTLAELAGAKLSAGPERPRISFRES